MTIKKIRCGATNPHSFHRENEVNESQYDLCVGFGADGYWADDPRIIPPPPGGEAERRERYYETELLKVRNLLAPFGQTDGQQSTVVMARTFIEEFDDRGRLNEKLADRLEGMSVRARDAEWSLAHMKQIEPDAPEMPHPFAHIVHAALLKFLAGYEEYGAGAADECGLAGQWGDLHRKVAKLKRSMWAGDQRALTRETEEEILQDIIGHCLLALEMKARGFEGGKS